MSHFYKKLPDGGISPCHFVEMASRKGELRPTRITDVRKMWKAGELVVPSVTTVGNILEKPALKNWLIDQHLYQAYLTHPDEFRYSREDYLSVVKRRAEEEMSKAPDAGIDLHTILEHFMLHGEVAEGFERHCANVRTELSKNCGETEWECERYFLDTEHGFGGCVDLTSVKYDGEWVIDYKSKQTADKFKPGKMAYPDHAHQLAAYRQGLGFPSARCANIFICIETGKVDFHEHSEKDLQTGWKVFEHSLAIWKLVNGVDK